MSMMLSVGPPESQARIGRPENMPSTDPIPKCSYAGVYRCAREEWGSAERWEVVKLRKKRMYAVAGGGGSGVERRDGGCGGGR
jgi:hypothetical protein